MNHDERKESVLMTKCIKDYLLYIRQRPKFLKRFGDEKSLDEIEYCEELKKRIDEWAKRHKVFYQYISGRINTKLAIAYIGTSERVFYRLMLKQKVKFLKFLSETENELKNKYVF